MRKCIQLYSIHRWNTIAVKLHNKIDVSDYSKVALIKYMNRTVLRI